jgi:hypothetical protein
MWTHTSLVYDGLKPYQRTIQWTSVDVIGAVLQLSLYVSVRSNGINLNSKRKCGSYN